MSVRLARLGDVCFMRTGKLNSNAAVEGGEYPFFTCAQETYQINEYAFETEAVLLGGNNANGIFPLKYYNGRFNAYQRTYVIESKSQDNLRTRYLYYALRPALSHFESVSIGAATQYLTKGILDNFKVQIYDVDIQTRIADILSAYDDLIENNRKRIALLERAARELYREWFVRLRFPGYEHTKIVDGVPEGWERKALGDVVEIAKGTNITRESSRDGSVPVVAGGLAPAYYHDTANVTAPVITVSASGANAGYVNIYYDDIWASDCSYIDETSTEYLRYIYLLLKSKQKEIFGFQKGSAQPHVYPKDLRRLSLVAPKEAIAEVFDEFVSQMFRQMGRLQRQGRTLGRARDILLPRLMSGEIAV